MVAMFFFVFLCCVYSREVGVCTVGYIFYISGVYSGVFSSNCIHFCSIYICSECTLKI